MAKIRTLIALQQKLDAELAWRIQDITALKRAVSGASNLTKDTFVRASIPMLYAHWEGFIKTSACAYSDYLENKGLKFKEVQPSFKGLKALEHVRTLADIRRRIFTSSVVLQTLQRIEEERVAPPLATYLDQIGNLNYSLFEQVAEFLSLDAAQYATKK